MSDRPVADRAAPASDRSDQQDGFAVDWELSVTAPRSRVAGTDRHPLITPSAESGWPDPLLSRPGRPPVPLPRVASVHSRRSDGVSLRDLTTLQRPDRLNRLRSLNLLDAPPRQNLDRLVRLACDLLDAPIGLLTVIDSDRQFFLAAHGLPAPLASARQTPLDYSLCQFAVATGRPLIVCDVRDDPVLADNPAVTELGVRAYVGIPLGEPHGHMFGTFCVIDVVVRDWNDSELATLARLAGIAAEACAQDCGPGWLKEGRRVASASR